MPVKEFVSTYFQKAKTTIIDRYRNIPVTPRRTTRFRRELQNQGYDFITPQRFAEIPQISDESLSLFVNSLHIQNEDGTSNQDRESGLKAAIKGMMDYINGQIIIDPFDSETDRRMANRDKYQKRRRGNLYKATYESPNQLRPINMTKVITGLLVIATELETINPNLSRELEERANYWFTTDDQSRERVPQLDDNIYQQFNDDERKEIVQKLIDDAVYVLNELFPNLTKRTIEIT